MESVICAYLSHELISRSELLPLNYDTSLLETGILDSLSLLRFLTFLEQEFNILVDDFELIPENFETIDAVCAYIRSLQKLQ